ncbi:rfaE bifunctional protein nucleotidyltransferase chain/domain [Anaerospora hongkongensis]|uniref:D-glycero-beta-D-manno-heptose 1-phosphate adenylyltransferase n=1 Tax=Anaerospora hongkongensis TaxID=244830 RepID=A0A4R1PV87_9FIRM|nr:D-glycero-beta-D-manno-heptose 1-phosphate adenylyltransferase [Anaerospora hongkongensis]TCL36057.1 rfaE bifunctional protein nucleotidyltransferase chain/domain [Anaerospora hongkongensis]
MKLVSRDQIAEVAKKNKAAGKILVFTNGCFDIIHAGHVRYLAEARKLGDCLIVGLNSDRSVRELKGPTRPVNHQEDRAEVMAALAAVDYVVVFNERTAEDLIGEVKPDIYVKGGDYRIEDIPEAKIVAANGGKTVLIPEVPGRSSSNIIKKISETN